MPRKKTASDKVLPDKAFNIAKNPKYDEYKGGLIQLFINFLDEKVSGSGVTSKIMPNQRPSGLVEELYKLIIKKIEKSKVHSSFTNSIWGGDLANIQLLSKFNKGFRFLLLLFIVNIHGLFL